MKFKLLLIVLCGFLGFGSFSQTTVSTNHINNNGNGSVIFNVQNTNAFDIIITDVNCHLGTSAANNIQLLYNTTPYTDLAAPWSFGLVGAGQNGWIAAGTAVVNSNTANGIVNALTGLSLTIPAGATYQLGLSASTMQYMTLTNGGGVNVNTFTGGGVNLITGDGVSWGGVAYPATPANYPRGFIGGITFIAAVPCTAPPAAGAAIAVNPTICPSTNNTISLSGGTGGTGQTYQWQSSTDGVTYANIAGATNSTYTSNQTVATYYKCIVTCSGLSSTSVPVMVGMNPFTNCYCNSAATSTFDEEIYDVTINGGSTDPLYSNANGCTTAAPGPGSLLSRYSNFKTLAPITTVAPGQTVTFSIVQDECDGATYFSNGVAMWVDFNQNGLFSDPGEQVYVDAATAVGPRTITGSFTVPGAALPGNTAVRIVCAEGYSGGTLTPCLSYGYGETEDHLITVACPVLAGVTSVDAGVCAGNTVTLTGSITNPLSTISWWDAASGGTQVGTGTSFTTGTLFANVSYWAQEDFSGCPSSARIQDDITVTAVDVVLTPIPATCNGLNNGSFTQTSVACGMAPFTYSLDNGVTYGAIPTNLVAGTYFVIVQDMMAGLSIPYQIIVAEPTAPTALNVSANYFSATLGWTAQGNETSWVVEYGPAGFTPGTGTTVNPATNPLNISGLTADTGYEFYVSAGCVVGSDVAGPFAFSTGAGFFTFDSACGPGFMDISGTGTDCNLTDDSSTGVTLPWPWLVNGTTVNTITIGNNGGVAFNTLTAGIFYNALANGFSIFSQDLNTPIGGVYYQDMGTAPNRQFVIMWDALPHWPSTTGDASFEIIVDEASGEIYYVYDDVIMGNVSYDYGADAEIACNVIAGNTLVSMNNATYLTNNSCVHFYNALCPNPVNIVSQVFPDEVILTWSAGLYGETAWTVIYGPTGFDPLTSGTTITTSLPFADILGLSQLTTYDFYIYSECALDNLTSGGLLITLETLPFCSNPTGINTATAVDSLFTSWSWLASAPAYVSTSFNLQYGAFGFNLYSGTVVNADNNFTDTTANTAFLAGGVYEVYVQAVCGTDTSSYMGPFTFVMPLSNDSVCGAEMLQVDGTVYTFNNTGATAQPGESALITGSNPAGYNPTELPMMTWGVPVIEGSNWYSFMAPPSGSLRFSGLDEGFFASQIAIYELTNCADFNTFSLVAASDQTDAAITTKVAPNFTVCGLTPGNTYYVLHDAWSNGFGGFPIFGQYSIKMTPIVLQAGSVASMANVCTGDTTNLFTTITGNDANGVWTAVLASANTQVTDSLFVSSGLAYQIFDFEYRMTDGCAYDTIISQVEIYNFSHAGNDGSFTVCKNEPVDLLSGLSGNVDLGGSWYDPSNNLMPSSSITASSIPGMFNYDYITGNGVCPDDTANVLVTVNPACDFLDIQEMFFGDMSLSPNPTNGLVYISNSGSSEVFNYEVTDVDGRVITTKLAAINGTTTTEVNLTGKVTGMYMIRVYNDNAMKVFRVILQ